MWGLDKESALHRFFVGEPVSVVASSPDGNHFAAGALSGAVYLWEVSTGVLQRTWNAHFKAVSAVSFACGGSVLVTAGEDTVVSAWALAVLLDPATTHAPPVPKYTWAEHALPVTSLAVGGGSGGGAAGAGLVASASADRTCKLWTLGGGHLLRSIELPAALNAVALDACEATLYAGAVDGRVFEVPLNAVANSGAGLGGGRERKANAAGNTSSPTAILEGHKRCVTAIVCSRDGERLVSASEDGTCRVWDVASRQTTHVLRHAKGSPIVALAVAPRVRVAGDGTGAGGAGERRRLAPLAPFSRFAEVRGNEGTNGSKGKAGKLESWEGAPVVMRGVSRGGVMDGGGLGYRGGVSGTSGLNALTKTNETETGGKKRRKGDTGGDDAAASLRVKLAVAEAETATAKEETVSWKKRHAELRAFVSEELVEREGK